MIKKYRVYIAILLLLFTLNAKAIVPLIGGLITAYNTAVAGATAAEIGVLLTGAGSLLYAQQMGYLDIKKDKDSDSVRFPLTNLPRDRPVANPELPVTATPTTTSGTTYTCSLYGTPSGTSSSKSDACRLSFLNKPYQCPNYNVNTGTCISFNGFDEPNILKYNQETYCLSSNCSGGVQQGQVAFTSIATETANVSSSAGTPVQTCGNGYTLSNGQCNLTEPQKIPDKNCDLQVSTNSSGGRYIKSNLDPDCAPSPVSVSPDGVAFMPVNLTNPTTGLPEQYNMIIVPDGAGSNCYYSVCIPVAGLPGHYQIGMTSTGTSANTNYNVISVDANGVVDGVRSGTMAGTIATSGTYVNAQGVVTNIVAGQPVMTQVNSAGQVVQAAAPAQTQVMNLPSDYARTGEALAAADKIVNKLSETDNMTDMGDVSVTNPLIQYFNPLYSWAPSVVAGSCPVGSFSWNGHTYGFGQFCTLFEEHATAIQSVMLVVSAVFALFIVLGA